MQKKKKQIEGEGIRHVNYVNVYIHRLTQQLFGIEGVKNIFFATYFVIVTKVTYLIELHGSLVCCSTEKLTLFPDLPTVQF